MSKYALLIANEEYDNDSISNLKAPISDCKRLEEVLKHYQIGDYKVTSKINLNESDFRTELSNFLRDRKEDDLILFYFAGHGLMDTSGKLYLAAKNSDRQDLTTTAVAVHQIAALLDKCESKRQVIILDCCYSSSFVDNLTRGNNQIPIAQFKPMNTNIGGYGRYILTSTDEFELAHEDRNIAIDGQWVSIYTHYLIQGLETGAADEKGQGYITVDDLHSYLHKNVAKVSRSLDKPQTPMLSTFKKTDSVIVANNPNYRYYLTAIEVDHDHLYVVKKPLQLIKTVAEDDIIQLEPLYSLPGHSKVHIKIVREFSKPDGKIKNETIFLANGSITAQPYYIKCQHNTIDKFPTIDGINISFDERKRLRVSNTGEELVIEDIIPIDLLFVLDLTMLETDIDKSIDIIHKISDISIYDSTIKFACVAFGEYEKFHDEHFRKGDKYIRNTKTNNGVVTHQLDTPESLKTFTVGLKQLVNSELYDSQDICNALESGLKQAALIDWRANSHKVALIIGNSPPHPSGMDIDHGFQPTDIPCYTVDEFLKDYDWHQGLSDLNKKEIELITLFIQPKHFYSALLEEYTSYVWSALSRDNLRFTISDDKSKDIAIRSIVAELDKLKRLSIDSHFHIPLCEKFDFDSIIS